MGRPAVLKVDIVADAKGVGKGVAEAEGRLGRLGGFAKNVGKAVAVGLAGAALAAGAFAASSVKAASSVEQSFGAVESVFGKAAAQVKGYAGTAATELGLAKSEYASLAAVVGSQLQSMGASQAESAVKSRELIGVGADLAATFGGSVSDAVGAVGSLLRGERDPIEKYGIAIKAADVQARLAADGQDKLTGAAKKTAEAQATLALLTEQSKNAHGAFGRESNTLAGQQERLRAQFENVKATVGAGLTPVLTSLLTFTTTRLLPGAQLLAGQLRDKLGPAFDAVGRFVTGTVLPAFRSLDGQTNGPTMGAARSLAGYFTGSVLPAFRSVAGFVGENVVPVLRGLAGFVVSTVIPAVTNLGGRALNGLRGALDTVRGAIDRNRTELAAIGRVMVTVGQVVKPLATIVGTVLAAAFRTAGGVISTVLDLLGAVVRAAQKAADAIGAVSRVAKSAGSFVGGLNPFSTVPLAGGMAQLVGGSTQPQTGALTTAATSPGGGLTAAARAMSGGAVVVVDQRSYPTNVRVDGALDPVGVARQLENLLREQAGRLGGVPAYGAAP